MKETKKKLICSCGHDITGHDPFYGWCSVLLSSKKLLVNSKLRVEPKYCSCILFNPTKNSKLLPIRNI